MIEVAIKMCKSGGIDTKVHGITVLGRVDMTEEEVAANFSFLTVDDGMDDHHHVSCQLDTVCVHVDVDVLYMLRYIYTCKQCMPSKSATHTVHVQ